MDPKLKETIEDGFADLEEQRKRDREELEKKIDGVQRHVTAVQAEGNTRPGGSVSASGHRVMAAIPDSCRHLIERREAIAKAGGEDAEKFRIVDPAAAVGMGLYMHLLWVQEAGKIPGYAPRSKYVPTGGPKVLSDLVEAMGGVPILKSDYAEDVLGTGGALVPTLIEREIARLILDNSVVRKLATVINMSSKIHMIPNEASGVTAYISPEGAIITAGEGSFGQSALVAHRYNGLATASNELFQDSVVALADYLFNAMAEKIGRLEDGQALQGDGVNVTGLSIAVGVTSFTSSGTVSSGGIVPVYDDLVRLAFAALESATRIGSAYVMHPGAYRQIVAMVNAQGSPIFPSAGVSNAVPNMILGFPVGVSSVIATTDVLYTSSTAAYYGNFRKLIFGDIGGISLMLDPYGLFNSFETRVRVVRRTGITIPTPSYFAKLRGLKYSV